MHICAASNLMNQSTSKERDAETGLDYFLARYYSGAQGRFISPDSYIIVLEMLKGEDEAEQHRILNEYLSNPQEWNQYSYVLNNPLKNIDPDGRNACGTSDDSTCSVKIEFQNRTTDPQTGKFNDQFKDVQNQKNYNAIATVSVTDTTTGKTTTAEFLARTTPSDFNNFATITNGTYSGVLTNHNGQAAIRLEPTNISTSFANPAQNGAFHAAGILIHQSGLNNFTGTFTRGNGKLGGVSEGCQLVARSQYAEFRRSTGITPDKGSPQRHFSVTLRAAENRRLP